MPRVGLNPRKFFDKTRSHARVTVSMTVHIPFLGGYWEQGLDVLKVCIGSLIKNTQLPFDLMIFDNRSCVEVQDYLLELRRKDVIQYLILSDTNVRQVGAWNFMFPAAPGEVIAYSDSDVLFLPGWLTASLEVLETFPLAGMITAQPARRRAHFFEHNSTTLSQTKQDTSVTVREGDIIPQEYLTAHRLGLGDTVDEYLRRIGDHRDVCLSKGGVQAFVTASDFQFLIPKHVVEQVFPLDGDKVSKISARVNQAGYWRLSTSDYLVHHIGNALPSAQNGYDGLDWLYSRGIPPDVMTVERSSPQRRAIGNPVVRYLLRKSRVRKIVRRLNVLSYRLLSEA